VQSLAERYGWKSSEAAFDPARPLARWRSEDRPRNPFRVAALVREEKLDLKDSKALLRLARECQEVVKLVPGGPWEIFR